MVIKERIDSEKADNTVYVPCDQLERRSNYAVCLNVIRAREEGRLGPTSFEDCCSALKKGLCPAMKMREEEILAGKAIYYRPRKKLPVSPVDHPRIEKKDRSLIIPPRPAAESPKPVKPKPKKPAIDKPVTFDAGALVNELMKEEVKPTVEEERIPTRPEPGESPLLFAKRKAAAMRKRAEGVL